MESDNGDDVMNVCRLCLGTDSLMSIFDNRISIPENMKDVIQVTTGVNISPTDEISQKLCYKCINITIRMFRFRSSSIVNELELKEKAAKRKIWLALHESVKSLLLQYPKIILPPVITESNISPSVSIDKNGVENWKTEYRKKKSLEKMMKTNVTLLENDELKRDLEKDITPHIIPNREILPQNQVENLEAEMNFVEYNEPPRAPESAIVVHENQSPTELCSENNIADEDLDNVAIEKRLLIPIENKGKRKLSLSMNKHETKKMKMDLKNNETEAPMNSLLDLKYVNECIFLCDICNNILYNVKDLKKHKNKHMRCSLCKRSFRSFRETEEHSEKYCPIKHVMDNLPNICLQRCDESDEIRKQYPSAFGLTPEKSVEGSLSISVQPNEPQQKDTPSPAEEISLISDEEENAVLESNGNPEFSCDKLIDTSKAGTTTLSEEKSIRPSSREKREKKNNANGKPNMEITGENVLNLNLDDDEISLVRNILKRTKGNIKESSIQTDLPNNTDIITSMNKDKLFEIKNLRKFLNYYKIPVNVSYASQYTAKFSNDPSLLSKYHHFDWSVMKPKKRPAVPISNDEVKIIENTPTKAVNEISKTAPPAYSMPPLILIRTQSQASSQPVYSLAVHNVQSTSSTTITTDSVKQPTDSIPQNINNNIRPASSKWNNCGNVQNNHTFPKNANIQNNTNIQSTKTPSSINLQNNTPPNNALNRSFPVITNSNSQIPMNSRKINTVDNTISTAKLQNNLFTPSLTSTNSSSQILNGKNLMTSPSVSRNNGNNNVIIGSTFCLTNTAPQAVSNNSLMTTKRNLATALPMQLYAVPNANTGVAPAKLSNFRRNRNGPYSANTTVFSSSNNHITMPAATVTSRISNVSQNTFGNVPAVTNCNTGNSCMNINIVNANINEKNKIVPTHNNISKDLANKQFSQNLILLNNNSNLNNKSRTSTSSLPSTTQFNARSIPQVNNSAVPSTSYTIHNFMPPPPLPPILTLSQQTKPTNASGLGTEVINQNDTLPASQTTSSSQWSGNTHFVPLIRVKNVSELR